MYKEVIDNFDFSYCGNITDVNKVVQLWTKNVLEVAETNIQNKLVMIRHGDKPWFNNYLRRLLRKKKKAHRDAKKSNTPSLWNKFRTLIMTFSCFFFCLLHSFT